AETIASKRARSAPVTSNVIPVRMRYRRTPKAEKESQGGLLRFDQSTSFVDFSRQLREIHRFNVYVHWTLASLNVYSELLIE
ncbi:MAG TPA: hypothetical protein VGC14_15740, partial [Rhizobium sp.]